MKYEITYSPHRIMVTDTANTAPFTVRYQFMPMYGPEEWFDYEPQTQVRRDAAGGERKEKK